jgi:hypothetical protein
MHKLSPARFRLVDNLLFAVATSIKGHSISLTDIYRVMVLRKDFTSVAGMTFDDVVRLAVKLDLVTVNQDLDQVSLKR